MEPQRGLPSVYATKKYALILANCCALSPVSVRMVGARAPSIVRWKNDNHEHAAMAIHGTHICHVTARSPAVSIVPALIPVVDIRSSFGEPGTWGQPPCPLGNALDFSRTGRAYDRFGHSGAVNHLFHRNRKGRTTACCFPERI